MRKLAIFTMVAGFASVAWAGPGKVEEPRKGDEPRGLSASKTVDVRWHREIRYKWTLEKLAAPGNLELKRDCTAEAIFSLTANRAVEAQNDAIAVTGKVCVTNHARQRTRGLKIVDELQQRRGSEWITIPGGQSELPGVEEVDGGQTRCFAYGFPAAAVSPRHDYRNRALVVTEDASADAAVEFDLPSEPDVVELDKVVALQDELHCPKGMSCSTPWPTLPPLLDHAQSLAYRTNITNYGLGSGFVEDAYNVARLVGIDTRTETRATAKVLISTGGRKGS